MGIAAPTPGPLHVLCPLPGIPLSHNSLPLCSNVKFLGHLLKKTYEIHPSLPSTPYPILAVFFSTAQTTLCPPGILLLSLLLGL